MSIKECTCPSHDTPLHRNVAPISRNGTLGHRKRISSWDVALSCNSASLHRVARIFMGCSTFIQQRSLTSDGALFYQTVHPSSYRNIFHQIAHFPMNRAASSDRTFLNQTTKSSIRWRPSSTKRAFYWSALGPLICWLWPRLYLRACSLERPCGYHVFDSDLKVVFLRRQYHVVVLLHVWPVAAQGNVSVRIIREDPPLLQTCSTSVDLWMRSKSIWPYDAHALWKHTICKVVHAQWLHVVCSGLQAEWLYVICGFVHPQWLYVICIVVLPQWMYVICSFARARR